MLSIKEYLILKKIRHELAYYYEQEKKENNGYANKIIDTLSNLIIELDKIIEKLEKID